VSISPWTNFTIRPLSTDSIRSSQPLLYNNFEALSDLVAQIIPGLSTTDSADYLGPASQASIWHVGSIGDAPSHAIGDIVQNGTHKVWNSVDATFDTLAGWKLEGTVVTPATTSWEIGSAGERLQKAWMDALDVTAVVASTVTPTLVTAVNADITNATIDSLYCPAFTAPAVFTYGVVAESVVATGAQFSAIATIGTANITNLDATLATIDSQYSTHLTAAQATITNAALASLATIAAMEVLGQATLASADISTLTATQITASATVTGSPFRGESLGAWDATRIANLIYLAGSDGFVLMKWENQTDCDGAILTDGSNPPTTVRATVDTGAGSGIYESIMSPVRKGDYWKAEQTTGTATVYWIPMGAD